jgi:hypothetical protein
MAGHLNMADDKELRLGNDSDLRLLSNNSNTFIDNYLGAMFFRQTVDDQDILFQCDNGSGGLATYLTLDGSAGDIKVDKNMEFANSLELKLGGNDGLRMQGGGANTFIDNYSGAMFLREHTDDGSILFQADNGSGGLVVYLTVDGSNEAVIINEDSADIDFRVESNGNENMIFVDGGNDKVGIGTNSPDSYNNDGDDFVIYGTGATGMSIASGTSSNGSIMFADGTGGTAGYRGAIKYNHGSDYMHFNTAAAERMRIDSSGHIGVGTASPSYIFHTHDDSADSRHKVSTSSHGTYFESGFTSDSAGILLVAGHASSILNIYLQGSGGVSNEFQFQHDGDFHADGDIVAYSTTVSDKRLKDNVKTIDSALDKVMKLRGVEFDWNQGKRKGQHDLGLIAQEVEEVLPELVRDKTLCTGEYEGNEKEFKTVDYDKIVGVLVEAIKEQQDQINELKGIING